MSVGHGHMPVWLRACVNVGDCKAVVRLQCIFVPVCLCLLWGPVDAPVGVLWLSVSVCATAMPVWTCGTCAHVQLCVTTRVGGHRLGAL